MDLYWSERPMDPSGSCDRYFVGSDIPSDHI